MLRKDEKDTKVIKEENPSDGDGHMVALLGEAIAQQMGPIIQEYRERIEELERKGDATGKASLIAAERVYNTPREHLSEFTVISLRMVDPFSLAVTCASILNEEVQAGRVSLGEIRMEEIKKLLRSVKGNLLDKGARLAEQQEVNKGEEVQGWEVKE